MWFLGSLLAISLTWAIWYPVGRLLAGLAPVQTRAFARFYFAPALGLAAFALTAGVSCWLLPLSSLPCTLLAILIGSVAWWRLPDRRVALFSLLVLCGGTALASYPMLAQVLRHEGYNPFNDTYTYLEHAQWLQDHAFREPARPDGAFPAAAQIGIYQRLEERMGASFMLAWMQAAMRVHWSFEVYPALAGALLTAGAWATAGVVGYLARCGRGLALGLGILAVTLPGGFRFGATHGFLPQTAGLTFDTVTLFVFALWLSSSGRPARSGLLGPALCIAVPLAAGTMCYFALLPFVGLSLLTTTAGVWLLRRPPLRAILLQLVILAAFTLPLLHVETRRAYYAILFNLSANVGTPMDWDLARYVGHGLAVFPGPWEPPRWVLGSSALSLAVGLTLFAAGLWHVVRRPRVWPGILGFAAFCGIGVLLFVKFRYLSPLPPGWTIGQGSSWSAFKVAGWLGPFLATVAVIGLARGLLALKSHFVVLRPIILAALLTGSLSLNHAATESAIAGFLDLSGSRERPYETLLALRRFLEPVPTDTVLNLEIPPESHKIRQLLVYFLRDHRLASDWSTDGYIGSALAEDQRARPAPLGAPRLYLHSGGTPQNLPTFGRITVDLESRDYATIKSAKTTHGREEDHTGWWYWVENRIEFTITAYAKTASKISPVVWLRPVDSNFVVYCEVQAVGVPGGPQPVLLGGDGRSLNLPGIPVAEGQLTTFRIVFYSSDRARPIGPQDGRMVTFFLKNLVLGIAPVAN
jgi:hypothetical protein